MSKPTPILFAPMVELNRLPDQERDVLRRFICEHVRGMDAKHDRRWRRLWANVFRAAPGEGFQLYLAEERSGPFHRRHRIILERLFQSQERFRLIDALHDWMKVGAYFVTWGEGRTGKPVPVPRSTNFEDCSEDEMREAHHAMVDYLHQPRSQRFLWPHLKAPARAEMLETILAKPGEGEER